MIFSMLKIHKYHSISDYIDDLFEDLILRREVNTSFTEARQRMEIEGRERPVPLAEDGPRAEKCDIVAAHRSRFNR